MLRGVISQHTRVVAVPSGSACSNPIFVIGAHRSGTSLVRRVLDSHPSVACPPESLWLTHYTGILQDHDVFRGLWGLGCDREEVLRGLADGARRFHEGYRQAKGKPRWADKTPAYTFHVETLRTLFGDDAQFVLVLRYPPDVAYSLWRRGWSIDGYADDALDNACEYVADTVAHQLAFRDRHRDACFTLHYDRLVRDPTAELRALCTFLREPWDPAVLEHHRHPHDVGVEDPVIRGTRGFDGSFDNWRMWSKEQQRRALAILDESMRRLGYSSESPFLSG